jgi:hypothetical protein
MFLLLVSQKKLLVESCFDQSENVIPCVCTNPIYSVTLSSGMNPPNTGINNISLTAWGVNVPITPYPLTTNVVVSSTSPLPIACGSSYLVVTDYVDNVIVCPDYVSVTF